MQKNDSAEHSSYKMYPNFPAHQLEFWGYFVTMQRQAFLYFLEGQEFWKWGGLRQIGIYYHIPIKQHIGKRNIPSTLQSTRQAPVTSTTLVYASIAC